MKHEEESSSDSSEESIEEGEREPIDFDVVEEEQWPTLLKEWTRKYFHYTSHPDGVKIVDKKGFQLFTSYL